MANFCSNCGNPVGPKDRFCNECGAQLAVGIEMVTNSPYVPDRGLWQTFFTFKGRINPKRYYLRMFVMNLAALILALPFGLLDLCLGNSVFSAVASGIFVLVTFLGSLSLNIRRCHDLGRPWWYMILMFCPPLLIICELAKERLGWCDMWGDRYVIYRYSNTRMIFGVFIAILYCMVMGVIFTFKSGTKGDNEYGPDPTGEMVEMPAYENKVLALLYKLEEQVAAWKIGALLVVGYIVLVLVGQVLLPNGDKVRRNDVQPIKVQQEAKQPAASQDKVPQPAKVPDVKNEEKAKAASQNKADKFAEAKNQDQKAAMAVLDSFHKQITAKNYRQAYNCLSNDFRSSMSYDGWAAGFNTTVASEVSNIKVVKSGSQSIVLNYILKATDSINGKRQVERFSGSVEMVKENGAWKIDEIYNKSLK